LWLGFKGIRNCVKQGHDTIFILAFVGYIIVGVGSISFHMTLKYPMQLVDELSMIYTTCLMMYASFAYSRSRYFSTMLGFCLLGVAGFITLWYHLTKDPVFHQVMYAGLTATVVFRSMWVMEAQLRPALEARGSVNTKSLLKKVWRMVAVGLILFIGGFAIWNLDNVFCAQIRRFRRAIGLPWAILLEGHGWWHLMTGIGAYCYITWGIWLRRCLEGEEDKYALHWPHLFTSMPEVRCVKEVDASSRKRNGHTVSKTKKL